MPKQTWNSWTCAAMEDEMGRPLQGCSIGAADGRRIWRRRARKSWLERAFQASLTETLERQFERSRSIETGEEVRTELVERVRAEIASGTYRVPAEMLAEKLIRTMRGDAI